MTTSPVRVEVIRAEALDAGRQIEAAFDEICSIASGCASTHGDPGGGLEMIHAIAADQSHALEVLARLATSPTPMLGEAEEEEAFQIGKRDGFSEAVQRIDELTGGDGEYRYCLGLKDDERHCPDPETMIVRIVERFALLPSPPQGGE